VKNSRKIPERIKMTDQLTGPHEFEMEAISCAHLSGLTTVNVNGDRRYFLKLDICP
jgi:hypothetical protein